MPHQQKVRAALFDLDDTILDRSGSLHDFVAWQANGMLRASVHDPSHFVERFIALDKKGMVWKDKVYESLIDEFNITDWSVEELLQTYLLTFCAFCKPRNGAAIAINEFKNRGYKIGLVSNGKSPFQERNFRALGFSQQFDCVIVSEAVDMRKPDKSIFEHACCTVNADINASVFIGDNPIADIKGAKKAGMNTIYIPVSPAKDVCEYADVTFTDLSEIHKYMEPPL